MNDLTLTYDEWIEAAKERTYHYGVLFPSGAMLQCVGDKIAGRVELIPLPVKTIADIFRAPAHKPAEPKRAPLPDSDTWRGIGHKALDTFGPEFVVTSGSNDRIGFAGKSVHPLQRFTSADQF